MLKIQARVEETEFLILIKKLKSIEILVIILIMCGEIKSQLNFG